MNTETNEQSSKTLASPKLSKVVLIVLAAHVVLILGFGVYCLLKGNTSGKDNVAVTEETTDPQVAENNSQPTVETNAGESGAATIAPVTPDTATAASTPSSMPATQDPIWNSAGNNNQPNTQTNRTVTPVTQATVAPQPQVTAPATVVGAATYAVQKGDSLYKIARKNGVTVAELKQANGLASDSLQPGQVLTIPGKSAAAVTQPQTQPAVAATRSVQPAATTTQNVVHAAVANSNAAASGYQSYKVAPGDTLWKIAKNFNTKPDVIAKANNITDPSKLKVGSEIKVPAQTRETASPVAQPQAVIPNVDVAILPHNRS